MKRLLLNVKYLGIFRHSFKLASLVMLMIIWGICSTAGVEAQRRGGGGHGRHGSPSWHYSRMHPRGTMVKHNFSPSRRIVYGGRDFYFKRGTFYRPYHRGFRVIGPPFGIRIRVLPRGFLRFYIGGFPYYYYGGTYYIEREGQYEVVAPPVGAVVESLPPGYEKVEIDGQTYYLVDGVQYKPILKDGEIWYEVIKSTNKSPEMEPNEENR